MNKTYKKIKVKNKSLKNKINFVTNFIFETNNKFYNGLYKKDKNLKDSFIHLLLYNKNYRKKRKILLIPHSVRFYNNFNSLLVFEDFKSIFYNNPNKFKDYLIIFMTTSSQHKNKNKSSLCYSSNNYYGEYNCFKIGGKQTLNLLKYLKKEYNVSKNITTFGYSDAGWLGSMLGYLGYVNKVIAFSGFSFNKFDNWKWLYERHKIPIKLDSECIWSDGEMGGYCTEFYHDDVEIGNIVNTMDKFIDVGFGFSRINDIINGKNELTKNDILVDAINKIIEAGFKPGPQKQGYVLRRLLRQLYKGGGSIEHPFFTKEVERQEKAKVRYERLKIKHRDKPKEWWFDTHGIDLDDMED